MNGSPPISDRAPRPRAVSPVLACLFLVLSAVVARAEPVDTKTEAPEGFRELFVPGFVFVHRPEDERSAERLASFARGIRNRIKNDLGIRDPRTVRVYLAASEDDYRALQPDGRARPEWSAGVAFPEMRTIIVYSPRGAGRAGVRKESRQVLVHELVHVYLHDALGDAEIPRWLHEGYARYRAGEGQIALSWTLTWGWLLGQMIPLDELIHRFPKGSGRARLAYAESLSFVAYLIGQYGENGFQTFLSWLRAGVSVDDALERVTGKRRTELEEDWITWLALRWTVLRILVDSGTLWAAAALLIAIGWLKVRARQKKRLAEMEEEEARALRSGGRGGYVN